MAGTFFKYAEREADAQINWASVGRDMSDMLSETNRIREEKKTAIDQATRESLMYLSNSPQGENINARAEILRYAAEASERIKIEDRLLKSGEISLQEYTIRRQNINDGTNLAFNANKAFQEGFKEVMNDPTISELVKMNYRDAEGYANYNQAGFYISENGTVMSALKKMSIVDGKKVFTMEKKPGSIKSVQNMNESLYARIKKIDIDTAANAFVDNLGVNQMETIVKSGLFTQGRVVIIDDIRKRADSDVLTSFLKAEEQTVKAIIGGSDTNYASTLVDRVVSDSNGQMFDTTSDPEEAKKNKNLILKTIGPGGHEVYAVTDEQKKIAENFVLNQLRAKYDRKVDVNSTGQLSRNDPSPDTVDANNKKKEDDSNVQRLGKLWGGDPASLKSAITAIGSLNGELVSLERDTDGVTATFERGGRIVTEKMPFRATNGKLLSQLAWVESAQTILLGSVDVTAASKRGAINPKDVFNNSSEDSFKRETQKKPKAYKPYSVSAAIFKAESDVSAPELQASLNATFGEGMFFVTDEGTGMNRAFDEIKIRHKDDPKGKIFKTDTSDSALINTATEYINVFGLKDFNKAPR